MRTELPGSDLGFAIPLVRNGEPFLPDGGNVSWSLRTQDGSQLLAPAMIAGVVDTVVNVTVPAVNNTVAGGLAFEKRVIFISCTVGGVPFTTRLPYRLAAWSNFTAAPEDVRSFMGIDVGELPDDCIDMNTAYLDVLDVIGATILTPSLASGGPNEISANRAIVARAVINVMPSAQARLIKNQADGTQQLQRFTIDFVQLLQDAKDTLAKNIIDLTPSQDIVGYKVSITSRNRDPFNWHIMDQVLVDNPFSSGWQPFFDGPDSEP